MPRYGCTRHLPFLPSPVDHICLVNNTVILNSYFHSPPPSLYLPRQRTIELSGGPLDLGSVFFFFIALHTIVLGCLHEPVTEKCEECLVSVTTWRGAAEQENRCSIYPVRARHRSRTGEGQYCMLSMPGCRDCSTLPDWSSTVCVCVCVWQFFGVDLFRCQSNLLRSRCVFVEPFIPVVARGIDTTFRQRERIQFQPCQLHLTAMPGCVRQ